MVYVIYSTLAFGSLGQTGPIELELIDISPDLYLFVRTFTRHPILACGLMQVLLMLFQYHTFHVMGS